MKVVLIDKKTNIVTGVTYLQSLEEVHPSYIVIEIKEDDNFDYMWRKYDLEAKKFSEEIYPPKVEEIKTQPTEAEQIKAQLISIQEYIVEKECNELKQKGGLN